MTFENSNGNMSARPQTNSNFRWLNRGQTATIGVVLLLGMVAISAIGIFLVAGHTVAVIEQDAETERIENSFVELSHSMASATSASETRFATSLAVGESGAVVKSDTGNIRIQGGDVDTNISVGEIEYRGDDGTRIAYQAGGVWRETGNDTHMLSAPPLEYDHASETLWFPIVETVGDEELGLGDVTITHIETDPLHEANRIENDSVTVTVKSEYYRGWQYYFEEVAGDASVRDVDHANQTVVARLGYLELDEAFDSGITVSEPLGEDGNVDTDDVDINIREGAFQELDDVIEEMEEDLSENSTYIRTINGSETLNAGTYYTNGVDLENNDTTKVNLSEGNATIFVDGDIEVDHGSFVVEEWDQEIDHELKIFTNGNMYLRGGNGSETMCVDPCAPEKIDSQQLQIYGDSNMSIHMHGGTFEGIIYAASNDFEGPNAYSNNDHQVVLQSNPDFYGAIVASSMHAIGGWGSIDLVYDEQLAESDIDLYPDEYTLPPRITYLNVAEYEVEVRNR